MEPVGVGSRHETWHGATLGGDPEDASSRSPSGGASPFEGDLYSKPPSRIGRFQVMHVLGTGGMGIVYAARDPAMDRIVAVKLLLSGHRALHRARLRREARALARLVHPNIVQIYDFGDFREPRGSGEHGGGIYMAIEWVDGPTLAQWQLERHRSCSEILDMYLQAGRALAAAHAVGLVHRDFKPTNVLVGRDGRARVLDFGLVHVVEQPSLEASSGAAAASYAGEDEQGSSLTRTGRFVGTPAYMAPEQFGSGPMTAATDQFSFCVALFEALHGTPPFPGDSWNDRAASVLAGRMRTPPRRSDVPASVQRALVRGLSPDPTKRWPSMDALLGALVTAQRRPSRRLLGAGVLCLPLGFVLGVGRLATDARAECQRVAESVTALWSETRASSLRARLTEGSPATLAVWDRLERDVRTYAEHWSEVRRGTCEALERTELTPSAHDATVACLERELEGLDATLRALESAPRASLMQGPSLVEARPHPEYCRRAEDPRQQLRPPPPSIAAEVREIRRLLAQCETHIRAGDILSIPSSCEGLLQPARALDYPPVEAEALFTVGEAMLETGQIERGTEALERSHTISTEHHHDRLALQAASALSQVAGLRRSDFEAAQRWIGIARAVLERLGSDRALAIRVYANEAVVRVAQGRNADALELFEQTLAWQRQLYGELHPEVVATYTNLGTTLLHLERFDRAARNLEAGLELARKVHGNEHPATARLLSNLGQVRYYQGHLHQAEALFRESYDVRRASLPPGHPALASSLIEMGALARRSKDFEQAMTYYREALELNERSYGRAHPRVATVLVNLADIGFHQGELEDARTHLVRAVAIRREAFGANHPRVAMALHNLGQVLSKMGRHDEARATLHEARGVFESIDPRAPSVGYVETALALDELDAGDPESALRHANVAVERVARDAGSRAPGLADAYVARASVYRTLDDLDAARRDLEEARELLAQLDDPDRREEVDAAIAELEQ